MNIGIINSFTFNPTYNYYKISKMDDITGFQLYIEYTEDEFKQLLRLNKIKRIRNGSI